MDRRAFLAGMSAVLLVPLAAETQQAKKIYKIGSLSMVLLPTGEDQTFGSTATVNSQGGSWLGQTDH